MGDNLKLLDFFSLERIILKLTRYAAYPEVKKMAPYLQAGATGRPCDEGRVGLWLMFLTP